ncbi:hypothetical protein AAVH_32325 [Aphelenchoides avenae]|nr:hypothetical protein AAVH_32325 [Aphelenchus avenae]
MSDAADYDKKHWTYDANADELTPTDLSIMEQLLRKLQGKLQRLRTANEKLTSIGDTWMDAAEKYPEKVFMEQHTKYRKLRDYHEVLVLQRNTACRTKELTYAIIKMQTSYDKGRKQLEGKSISTKNGNRSGLPGPTRTYKGSGSAAHKTCQGAPSFNASSFSAYNDQFDGQTTEQASQTDEQGLKHDDVNEPSSDSGASAHGNETAEQTSHADEHGLKNADVNKPSSDSEASVHSTEAAEQASQVDDITKIG